MFFYARVCVCVCCCGGESGRGTRPRGGGRGRRTPKADGARRKGGSARAGEHGTETERSGLLASADERSEFCARYVAAQRRRRAVANMPERAAVGGCLLLCI